MTTRTIVVMDTESTGFEPSEGAALLEVAWAAVHRHEPRGWAVGEDGTYASSFVQHVGGIPPEARAVHHIAPEQVAPGAPNCLPRESVLHSLLAAEDPGEMMYAFHNAAHDRKFLPELGLPVICTYRCALHMWPDAPGHSNQVLRYWLGVEPPEDMLYETDPAPGRGVGDLLPLAPHRALYDTAVTAAILQRMLTERTPEELLALTEQPVLLTKCRFGKHRGERWADIPRSYLDWMLNKSDMCREDPDLRHTVRHHLGLSPTLL